MQLQAVQATMRLDRAMAKKLSRHDMPDSWRIRVRAWLVEHGMEQRELAERIGAKPSTITRMLGLTTDRPAGIASSRFAPRVARLTGIALPPPDADAEASASYELWTELRRVKPSEADQIVALMRSLLGKPVKKE